jgi:integrase
VRTGHADQPLSGATVGRAVKLAVQRIGLDPKHYAGHSLRSGLITAAAEAGASELLIAAHTGHRSLQTLQRYFRRTDLFRSNVCAAIGL